MNETLIKELIKYKLDTAFKIVDHLPPRISGEIKDLGRIILESVNEISQETKEQPSKKPKPSGKLNNVPIE